MRNDCWTGCSRLKNVDSTLHSHSQSAPTDIVPYLGMTIQNAHAHNIRQVILFIAIDLSVYSLSGLRHAVIVSSICSHTSYSQICIPLHLG